MRRLLRCFFVAAILVNATACGLGWKHRAGALVLPESHSFVDSRPAPPPGPESAGGSAAGGIAGPRRMSLTLPDGWNWVMRGDDLFATRDGVFLQNIVVERIHADQVKQALGAFPLEALSSKQWPLRTAASLKKRFTPGMSPGAAADVLIESRRNDRAVTGLEVRDVSTRTIAGTPAFRAVFDFGLRNPWPLWESRRIPRYRSIYCGMMRGEWFYGIGYTAAVRHYYEKDADTFEAVLRSVSLDDR